MVNVVQALQTKLGIPGGPSDLEQAICAALHSRGGIKGLQRALAGIDPDESEKERKALHDKHVAERGSLTNVHQNEVTGLRHEISHLQAQIAETRNESEVETGDGIDEREIEELNAVIEDLRSELERNHRETDRLHPQIQDLKAQLTRMRVTNERLGQEVIIDEKKIKNLKEKVKDENEEIKTLKDQIATLKRLPMQLRRYHGH